MRVSYGEGLRPRVNLTTLFESPAHRRACKLSKRACPAILSVRSWRIWVQQPRGAGNEPQKRFIRLKPRTFIEPGEHREAVTRRQHFTQAVEGEGGFRSRPHPRSYQRDPGLAHW